MAIWKTGCLGAAVVLGSSLLIGQASAMPANGLATVASNVTATVQDAHWVCGPYGCWWTRSHWWGPRYYGFYGPRHHYWGWRYGWRYYGWRHRWS